MQRAIRTFDSEKSVSEFFDAIRGFFEKGRGVIDVVVQDIHPDHVLQIASESDSATKRICSVGRKALSTDARHLNNSWFISIEPASFAAFVKDFFKSGKTSAYVHIADESGVNEYAEHGFTIIYN